MADSIFDLDEFKPYEKAWKARVGELATRAAYYDGSVYRGLSEALQWLYPRLGKCIKALYLPLSRAVDVDAGIVPGGWSFADDAPEAWDAAWTTLRAWSSWATRGVLYVHYGAVYGLSGLKIVDAREQKQVQLEPVDPACFMLVASGQYSAAPSMALWIETRQDAEGEYEYAEAITPERIRTFKRGTPFGFDRREPEYPNAQKVVPFIEVRHIETGQVLGECTYQKAIPLLDEVNSLASQLAEIIRKNSDPQWAVFGAVGDEMEHSSDNVWFFPNKDGRVEILVPKIDVAGVLEFIREIRDQVFGALPELAFDELKKKDQIATATLELQLMELVLKIKRCRPNYDDGLIRAMRLAGRAAAGLGLGDVAALDDEELALDDERQILPIDAKTALEIEQLELQVAAERNYPALPEEGTGD